ncbi:GTPase domain-containing protein [Catellatospora sp. KI3]|uniref:GTPase domain-containing protein n=1 Tax=Catellatospora sp. KI3 TaxID=3041620 RepID=UPI00248230A8|nr:GTPase domain-containing protein [Catellatospora sp. KI3]MDI1461749.1 GTPase domain-containing protein [Catellatospora sp. KI3]
MYDHSAPAGPGPHGPLPSAGAVGPLLAIVGGPTGAGKSTLVNSLVRAPVSATGFLRPTTRRPVLVCHTRSWASAPRHDLHPIASPALPPNLALVDAPDLNSIDQGSRELTESLFDQADLWIFMTTAARYADAEAWRHLRAAQRRRVDLAVVLNRVPHHSADEILPHLTQLLGEPVPLFVVAESTLDRQGMLAERIVTPIWEFLHKTASAKLAESRVGAGSAEESVRRDP